MRASALLLVFAIAATCTPAANAAVSIRADRTEIRLNESFNLIISVTGDSKESPDLAALEADFEILQRSQQSRMEWINGQYARENEWRLALMARRPGVLMVPAIQIGAEHTEPLAIRVRQPDANPTGGEDIYLEAEVSVEKPYVQAQIIYTVRLFVAVETTGSRLTEPRITGVETLIEKLGADNNYQSTRDARQYLVVERRYALFPQHSGSLIIEPVTFETRVVERGRFARIERFQTEPVALDVQPIPPRPADIAHGAWLPAQKVTLEERWSKDPSKLLSGEPITRTLSLRAEGLLATQLPETSFSAPDGLKTYPDQPVLETQLNTSGIVATREDKIAMIASRAGSFRLPEVVVPWWNVNEHRWESARIAPATISARLDSEASTIDGENLNTNADFIDPMGTPLAGTPGGFWRWLTLLSAGGWILTLLLWWQRGRRSGSRRAAPEAAEQNLRRSNRQRLRQIRQACKNNDALACQQALLAWAEIRWPANPPRSVGVLAQRCGDDMREALELLSARLYGAHDSAWDGAALLSAIARIDSADYKSTSGAASDPLLPLYR